MWNFYISFFFFKDLFISLAAEGINISVNITTHLDTLKLTYPPHLILHGDKFNPVKTIIFKHTCMYVNIQTISVCLD